MAESSRPAFADFERKDGDLYVVATCGGRSVYVCNAIERVGGPESTRYRGYFSFLENGVLFDSSLPFGVEDLRQVVRNGSGVWFGNN